MKPKVVQFLDLGGNGLCSLDGLVHPGESIAQRLASLRKLDLSENKLQSVPSGLFQVGVCVFMFVVMCVSDAVLFMVQVLLCTGYQKLVKTYSNGSLISNVT